MKISHANEQKAIENLEEKQIRFEVLLKKYVSSQEIREAKKLIEKIPLVELVHRLDLH